MNSRTISGGALGLCGCLAALSGPATAADSAPPSRPNIVILLADDLGYGETGCQGNPEVATPHIDSLADDGVRFTDGYVTASYCSPSRAGLLTGRYQTRFGYEFNPIGADNEDPRMGLPRIETTLAERLRNVGYATALIGKWHLGGSAAYHPLRHGFDEFFGFLHEGHYYVPPPWRGVTTMLRRRVLPDGGQGRWTEGKLIHTTHMGHDEPAYDANNPILRAGQPVREPLYLTEAFTREAIDFIDRNQRRPFFLYLAYNAVHSPLQATNTQVRRLSHIEDAHRRIFAAMLRSLDDSVGAVLKKLRDSALEESTLVFFLSDNGGPTKELTSSNLPLRGGKGDLYEGGIRVPFLALWKGVLPPGFTYRRPVISLDLYATAVAVAGAGRPDRRLDGVNLLPFLTGQATGQPHDTLFWRQGERTAVRVGDWKLVKNPRGRSGQDWELYDLATDLAEARNRADSEPERFREALEVWERMNGEMVPPSWRRGR